MRCGFCDGPLPCLTHNQLNPTMTDDDLAELVWELDALSSSPIKSLQQGRMAMAAGALDRLVNLLSDLDSIYDEIGAIATDSEGKCRWSDVAVIQDAIRRMRHSATGGDA